jgi:hypothetical protein
MEAEKAPLRVYKWREDEMLVVDWYAQLVQSGDMYVTFMPEMRYMGNFLQYWRHATLGYAMDSKGIFFAFWLDPLLSGAFFGVWIRSEYRGKPVIVRLVTAAMDEAFKFASVLIALCKQEHLRDIISKLGAKLAMTIPGLWNGEAADAHVITKDEWEASRVRRAGTR